MQNLLQSLSESQFLFNFKVFKIKIIIFQFVDLHKRHLLHFKVDQLNFFFFKMGNRAGAIPEDDTTSLDNIKFYSGKIKCKPDNETIDNIHKKWFGQYKFLEVGHGYIQWLFPIREGGMNPQAQPLSKYESELFKKDSELQKKFIKSYKLILDFYGMKLIDEKTGKINRNENNYKHRYYNLNNSFHNYLRITRILKSLGLVGFEHYKKPLIDHFVVEVFQNNELPNTMKSLVKFWIPTLRKESDLKEIENKIYFLTGKKIDRSYYEKEELNWSNTPIFDSKKEK